MARNCKEYSADNGPRGSNANGNRNGGSGESNRDSKDIRGAKGCGADGSGASCKGGCDDDGTRSVSD